GLDADMALIGAAERAMREGGLGPDQFFFAHRGGRHAEGPLAEVLSGYDSVTDTHPYWSAGTPQSMLIDEVESIWAAIAERDDWSPLESKIAALREMGEAHGEPPAPAGHVSDIT